MSLYSDIIQDFTRSTNKSVLNAAWLLKNIAPGIILTNIDKAVRKKACFNSYSIGNQYWKVCLSASFAAFV